MKIAIATICLATSVHAFAPSVGKSAFGVSSVATSGFTALASDKKDDNEGGLDLDLGEMFEMFEAADNEEKFDDAVKKIKKDEKETSKK